ncbi:putative cyclin-dependent kinase F-2 [Hordeum vulgare]|nr:putative cyclin-dependent kinase F-2 [Hordeum vulgare]
MAAFAGKKEAAWPLTMARYERLEKLGEGINGEVFKPWDTEDNLIVAVKRLSGSGDDGFIISTLPEVMREAMCLGACGGIPSILQRRATCVAACQREANDFFIVMDYVGRLNLRGYMQRRVCRRRPFSEDEVRRIMKQLVEGVTAVHAVGVLHLDIKPENALLDDGTEDTEEKPKKGPVEDDVRGELKEDRIVYKIGGFGMSMKGRSKRQPEVTILTPYSAPELLLHSCEYDDRVDTWGLGCIMADLLSDTGVCTFDGESDIKIMAKVFGIVGTEGTKDWSGYSGVIDLSLELINPVIEPGQVLTNVIGINPVLAGELRDHHVVGVESTLHHPLALEDFLLHCFEPRLHACGLLGPLNMMDVQHPLMHLDRLRVLQHSRENSFK